ncbi:MAG TPA: hypothetical protein VHF45_01415 [Thermoleophilaceae bacterium]|jgi:hypothetical protein|nr:hypothetical protein [Thermoleophilaceae bacterium]
MPDEPVVGTSFTSFADAATIAFDEIPGDPDREGAAAADVARLWLTKGGVVGRVQYHVELTRLRVTR